MGPGRPQIPIAFTTMLHNQLLRDALSDINLGFETVDAGVRLIGHHQYTADAAATKLFVRMEEILTSC